MELKEGDVLLTNPTVVGAGVLDCNTLRSFWISWHDRQIAVGNGDVIGYNEYLRHEASSSDVIEPLHAVKIESHHSSEAKWQVTRETGE